MTDQIREQMSALLDGELPSGEAGLLVRRMERDAELRRAFGSYVLAGESLRAPGARIASPGFASRVSAALAEGGSAQEAVVEQQPARSVGWRRPLTAAAVAAGAAWAAVVFVQPGSDDAGARVAATAASGQPVPFVLPSGGSSPTPAQHQRLAGYLVVHGQYATPIGRRNVWSSALAADPGIYRAVYGAAESP